MGIWAYGRMRAYEGVWGRMRAFTSCREVVVERRLWELSEGVQWA